MVGFDHLSPALWVAVNSRQTLTMSDLGEEATTHTRNSSSTSQVPVPTLASNLKGQSREIFDLVFWRQTPSTDPIRCD